LKNKFISTISAKAYLIIDKNELVIKLKRKGINKYLI